MSWSRPAAPAQVPTLGCPFWLPGVYVRRRTCPPPARPQACTHLKRGACDACDAGRGHGHLELSCAGVVGRRLPVTGKRPQVNVKGATETNRNCRVDVLLVDPIRLPACGPANDQPGRRAGPGGTGARDVARREGDCAWALHCCGPRRDRAHCGRHPHNLQVAIRGEVSGPISLCAKHRHVLLASNPGPAASSRARAAAMPQVPLTVIRIDSLTTTESCGRVCALVERWGCAVHDATARKATGCCMELDQPQLGKQNRRVGPRGGHLLCACAVQARGCIHQAGPRAGEHTHLVGICRNCCEVVREGHRSRVDDGIIFRERRDVDGGSIDGDEWSASPHRIVIPKNLPPGGRAIMGRRSVAACGRPGAPAEKRATLHSGRSRGGGACHGA